MANEVKEPKEPKVEKDAEKMAKAAKQARKVKEANELTAIEAAYPALKVKMDAQVAQGSINLYMTLAAEPALYKTFATKKGIEFLTDKGYSVHPSIGLLDIYWDRSDALVSPTEETV